LGGPEYNPERVLLLFLFSSSRSCNNSPKKTRWILLGTKSKSFQQSLALVEDLISFKVVLAYIKYWKTITMKIMGRGD